MLAKFRRHLSRMTEADRHLLMSTAQSIGRITAR